VKANSRKKEKAAKENAPIGYKKNRKMLAKSNRTRWQKANRLFVYKIICWQTSSV
jgi:hypothetical protein